MVKNTTARASAAVAGERRERSPIINGNAAPTTATPIQLIADELDGPGQRAWKPLFEQPAQSLRPGPGHPAPPRRSRDNPMPPGSPTNAPTPSLAGLPDELAIRRDLLIAQELHRHKIN